MNRQTSRKNRSRQSEQKENRKVCRENNCSPPSSEEIEDSNWESEQETDASKQQKAERSAPRATQDLLEKSCNSKSDNQGHAPRAKNRREQPSRYPNTSSTERVVIAYHVLFVTTTSRPRFFCQFLGGNWYHCFCAFGSNTSSREWLIVTNYLWLHLDLLHQQSKSWISPTISGC